MATPLNQEQLNAIAKQTGYTPTGGGFSSTGLPNSTYTTPSGAVVDASGNTTTLPPAVAPTNVKDINQTGTPTLPSTTPSNGSTTGIGALTDYYKSLFDTATKQASDAQTQRDQALTQQKQQTSGFLSNLMNAKSASQTRSDAQAQTGIDPNSYFAEEKAKITELGSLNEEYNSFKAQVDQQKAALQSQGRGIPIDLLNNQAAQIDRNAAPRLNLMSANINSKAATLQASQGMFSEASKYVEQAVTDATADLKFNADMYKTFYDQNQSIIDSLDNKYKEALTTATTTAQNAYTLALNEKKSVGELMINPDYAGAGITITDSLQQAQTKASAYVANNPNLDTQLKKAQIAKIYSDIQKQNTIVDQNAVDGWVKNINSGKAKLTDIKDANLRTAVSTALSKSIGSISDTLQQTKDSLVELQNMVKNDSITNPTGFRSAVGVKGISSFFGLKGTPIAGSGAANFDNKLKQILSEVVLPNLDKLRGLGRVTQKEFDTLQASVTSLNTNLSETEFKKELNTLVETIDKKLTETSSSGVQVTDPNGMIHSFPDQASADAFKKAAGIK